MKKLLKKPFKKEEKPKKNKSISTLTNEKVNNNLNLNNDQSSKNSSQNKEENLYEIIEENNTKNAMTDNKNNTKTITNEQPSIATDNINTSEGSSILGNKIGDNADFSNRPKSWDKYGATISGSNNFSGGQNVFGGKNHGFAQNNYNTDDESKLSLEIERIRKERRKLEDEMKDKLDKDGKKLLREILSIVRKHVREKKGWKDGSDQELLWEKIDELEEKKKLANNEIEELCQAQAEETKLELELEMKKQQKYAQTQIHP